MNAHPAMSSRVTVTAKAVSWLLTKSGHKKMINTAITATITGGIRVLKSDAR